MIFEMWWAWNKDFLCLIVKLVDLCVCYSQRWVVVKKYLLFCVDLLLCGLFLLSCLFFSLYLDFFSVCVIFLCFGYSEYIFGIFDWRDVDGPGAEQRGASDQIGIDGSEVEDDKEGADVTLPPFLVLLLIFRFIELYLVMLCCKLIYSYEYMVMVIKWK